MYKFIKPIWDAVGGGKNIMSLARGEGIKDNGNADQMSESKKTLLLITSSSPIAKCQIKGFGTIYRNIQQSLKYQPEFLSGLVDDYFKLKPLKESLGEKEISQQEKIKRWQSFKISLFAQIYSQVYSYRISNLLSIIKLCLTGRCKFESEKLKMEREDQILMNNSNEQRDRGDEDKVQLSEEQMLRLLQQTEKCCNEFLQQSYNFVTKNLIEQFLFNEIKEKVEQLISNVTLQDKFKLIDLNTLFQSLHNSIISQFFSPVSQNVINLNDENNSQDDFIQDENNFSDDSYQNQAKPIWITSKIIEIYKNNEGSIYQRANNEEKEIMKKLFVEFLDFIETDEYFQSLILDIFDESFNIDLKQYILDQMKGEAFYQDEEQEIQFVKIITFIYRLQDQGRLNQKLKDCEFNCCKDNLLNFMRMIYFDDVEINKIETQDLLEYKGNTQSSMMQGLDGMLGGLDIESIFKMIANEQN